jgi:NTE family protein
VTAALTTCGGSEAKAQNQTPKVCLVLSGGGARGAAHVGVLKVFEQERLPVDCIAGTSFGAVVGGLFSIGYSAAEIERILLDQDWNSIFSDAPQRRLTPLIERKDARYQAQLSFKGWNPELPTGLLGGQRLTESLDALTAEAMLKAKYDFDNLPIQFRVVASNLIDGKVYVFRNGSMAEALRASMAIPMLFTPVEKEDMLLVDGGLADNLPTDVARALGASIIIAVDASSPLLRKEEIRSFINVMDQSLSLRMEQNEAESRKLASIVLKPDLEAFTANDYDKIPEILERGEEEAGNRLEELKALVAGIPFHPLREVQENGSPVIDSLSFRGLKQVKPAQLEPNLRSRPGEAVDLTAISADVRRLYATRLFDSVGYDLEPLGGNRYRLVYVLKEAPLRSLGVGLRYDNDYNVVALAEFTARHLFDSPSRATVSSQFGGLQDHSAALRLISSAAPFFFVEPRGDVRRLERRDIRDQEEVAKFTDMREGTQLLMGASLLRQLEIDGGYRIERVRIDHGAQPNSLDGSVVLAGLTLRVNADSLDHPDFPRSGLAVKAQYDKRSRWLGGDLDYSKLQADYRRYFPLSANSVIQVNASAGYSHGPVPFYDLYFIGGYSFSEKAARQFLGLIRDEIPARQVGIAGASFRRQLFSRPLSFLKRGYLTGIYNGGFFSDREASPYNFGFMNGAGIGLAFDTMLGPIRATGGWAEGGRFNFYLSIGPGF